MSENKEKPTCPAHGKVECPLCSLNPAPCDHELSSENECGYYSDARMHWDTCPHRVNRIDGNGDWVMQNGDRITPRSHRLIATAEPTHGIFDDLDPQMFVLIRDMSKEDLIKEILDDQRSELSKVDIVKLREMVAAMRVENFKRAIMKEAGLKVHYGPLGIPHIEEDND